MDTCPANEVEISVTDMSQFFIMPYHLKEEANTGLDNEIKR